MTTGQGEASSSASEPTTGDIERQKKKLTKETIERFGPYRRPTDVTIPKYQKIQEKALEFALLIDELCPHSQQKATALTQLEMCKMSANAAIAIHS